MLTPPLLFCRCYVHQLVPERDLHLGNFRLRNIRHAESRLPIPSGIVDRLVANVLVLVDAHPFLGAPEFHL